MNNDIQTIQNLVNQYSLLTKREEIDLVASLHKARPQHVRTLAYLFQEDPRWIQEFYQSYQARKRALIDNDTEAWNQIVKDELVKLSEQLGIEE